MTQNQDTVQGESPRKGPALADSDFGPLAGQGRKRLTFDPTINAGHILTFLGFIGAGFGAYSALDKRVAVVEQAQATSAAVAKDAIGDLKAEVRETRRTVEEMARSQMQRLGSGR